VETLWRVSRALQLPLGSLLAEDEAPRVRVVASESGKPMRAASGMAAWLIHADARDHRSELFDLRFTAGLEQRAEPHMTGTEEVLFCVSGRLRAGPAGEQAELGPGDALWFAADVPHGFSALQDARVLCWMRYPAAGAAR
jgi:quercetin dioxygenase-like cupin family protein